MSTARERRSPWNIFARVAFTAIFFFWLYLIWNSTSGLKEKIDSTSGRITAIHHIQVEFKGEVDAWLDMLLRSTPDTLNQNWNNYESKFQAVTSSAETILSETDVRGIHQKMKSFIEAHNQNHDKYKAALQVFIKSNYNPKATDATVKDIDEPLLEYLEVAELDMHDELRRLNDNMIEKARSQIEQSLVALLFVGLLAIWMPKH